MVTEKSFPEMERNLIAFGYRESAKSPTRNKLMAAFKRGIVHMSFQRGHGSAVIKHTF